MINVYLDQILINRLYEFELLNKKWEWKNDEIIRNKIDPRFWPSPENRCTNFLILVSKK